MRQAFEDVDVDGSGTLDWSEVRKLCESLGLSVDEATFGQIMAELDMDRSGGVDFSEFSRWWTAGDGGSSPISPSDADSSGGPASKEMKKRLKAQKKEAQRLEKERKKEEKQREKARKSEEKAKKKLQKQEEKQRQKLLKKSGAADSSELVSLTGSPGKQLDRKQVHEMVRLQLELDGWHPDEDGVADEWIDDLFNRFDVDGSGFVDDAEWDLLVPAMRLAAQQLAPHGGDSGGGDSVVDIPERPAHHKSSKQLDREQVHEMVRLQLELDGWHPDEDGVTDAWIDGLFNRFDVDGSGYVDDTEWDLLVPAMRHSMDKLAAGEKDGDHSRTGKHLDRSQVHEMVRLQLELDGWDPNGQDYVSDAWIDDLFSRFDSDHSGIIDDAEWDALVPAMRCALWSLSVLERFLLSFARALDDSVSLTLLDSLSLTLWTDSQRCHGGASETRGHGSPAVQLTVDDDVWVYCSAQWI